MISHRTPSRTAISVGVVLLAIGMFAGCTPKSEPTPTPTAAFASEEEAFAAAEEVYRAYNEAVNADRLGDDAADPLGYLVGAALNGSLNTSAELQSQGLRIVGSNRINSFVGMTAQVAAGDLSIRAQVCLDVSQTAVLNSADEDVTPPGRTPLVPLDVAFVRSESGVLISESELSEGTTC